MPRQETKVLEERISMLREYDTGYFSVTELCRRYGVAREPFYVLQRRRDGGDERWYEDVSRAPLSCRHKTPGADQAKIIALRKRFRHWGRKRLALN